MNRFFSYIYDNLRFFTCGNLDDTKTSSVMTDFDGIDTIDLNNFHGNGNTFEYNSDYNPSTSPMFFKIDYFNFGILKGRDLQDFIDFMEDRGKELTWRHGECTVNGVRRYHPESRIVWKCETIINILIKELDIFLYKNKLVEVGPVEFLKYDTGCFASKHVDKMGEYTALLFPKEINSTGGELILYDTSKPNGKIVFKPYNLEHDTLVIFPAGMEHEVLPVTSGERYVFKIGLANKPKLSYVHAKSSNGDNFTRRFSCQMD